MAIFKKDVDFVQLMVPKKQKKLTKNGIFII